MEISLADLKEKEIINVSDGRKLGRIIDILFDIESGLIRGIVVPGEKKIFKKAEDIFIPLEKLKKIGDDVILVKLQIRNDGGNFSYQNEQGISNNRYSFSNYYDNYHNPKQNLINLNQQKMIQDRRKCTQNNNKSQSQSNNKSFVRFKPINNLKYK